jgi:hypothetical protein
MGLVCSVDRLLLGEAHLGNSCGSIDEEETKTGASGLSAVYCGSLRGRI